MTANATAVPPPDKSANSRRIQSATSFSNPISSSSSSSSPHKRFASAPVSAPLSFSSSSFSSASGGGGGGGFFSGGETIAERARRLKEERQKKMNTPESQTPEKSAAATNGVNGSGGGDEGSIVSKSSSMDESKASESGFDKASLHEFDSLLISNQAGETENVLHKRLVEGFRGLRDSRLLQASGDTDDKDDASSLATEEQRRYSATVNFIDPTTKHKSAAAPASTPPAVAMNPAKPTNLLQQQSMLAKRATSNTSQTSNASSVVSSHIENVYESLTTIFEKEYNSTIRSVRFKNVRTGEVNTIKKLPVRPVITMSGSSRKSAQEAASPTSSANTPWGGTATTAMMPVSDPSEWHTGPFCHVYIAACESVEHYRTKVRPSLKAFVSQLESSDSNTTANTQGGHSADYLIVFIPVGDKSGPPVRASKEPTTPAPNRTNSNTGGRFGWLNRGRSQHDGADTDDLSKTDSVDSGDERMDMSNRSGVSDDDSDAGTINVLRTFNHLTKTERTLYKKIVTNFPNGKVCVLSPSSLDKVFDSEDGLVTRVQEWNVFNRLLGQVIVNGFQDRIRRYKAELKRLDAQRASAATAAKNNLSTHNRSTHSRTSPSKPNPYAFNLGHFFLVKESLAFSYEQMQLPEEALLQYDEFRLYMPDLSDKDEKKVRRARRKSKALQDDTPNEGGLQSLADAGDFLGFRKKVRTEYDLTAILDIMRRYLFARELSLLFRMERPVEILSRCQAFVKIMHSIVLRGIFELETADQHERKSKAAAWVVQFSWDVYCSAMEYLSSPPPSQPQSVASPTTKQRNSFQSDEAVAARLSDILEVSRLFVLQLAEDHEEPLKPFSDRRKTFPSDLKTPWQPWEPLQVAATEDDEDTTETKDSIVSQNGTLERKFLVTYEDTLESLDKFEEAYLKLCGAIIDARKLANHIRQSARIQAEIGEYYVSKGDLRKAAASFQKIVKIYRIDHWDRCHFWRVFRLAYCQRTSVEPTAYLKTLCSCFSPRSAVVAPKKALEALFDDLQRVIEHKSIGEARYSRLLFIETTLSIALNKSEMERILDQKDVDTRFCSVGESVKIPISISSHLPGSIELNTVKLFAVSIDVFKSIMANGDAVQEEDAATVLSVDTPIKLNPGSNDYAFEWSPPRPGKYILSTVEILWKEGYFYYDSMDLQEPLLSIEVLPNEPTHSISFEPAELVPGHDQKVQVTFDAGSDTITSTKLILSGTRDILLMPPGEDLATSDWLPYWETDLEPFKPGDKHVLTVRVRCGLDPKLPDSAGSETDSDDLDRGLVAKALTTYVYAPPEGGEQQAESDPHSVETTIAAYAPVLEKRALSVESVETHWLEARERFLLSIELTSNTSSHFTIDEWDLNMPSPITISSTTDLNENLQKRSVFDGDQLSFAFECCIDDKENSDAPPGSSKGSKMHLKLCDDEGKKFWIDLALDLGGFYLGLLGLESRSKPTGTMPAALTLEASQGVVGEPLAMTFAVDCKSSNDDGSRLVYSIGCDSGHWLLGGKVSGVLSGSGSQTLSFVGVPVVSGVLDQFPSISIERLDTSGSSVSIRVEHQPPEAFQSMPLTQINAIATPRYEDR